jgi:nanoRNase/pAp phosphatase (c-di-AMP/oligoRNAs hydrolase)
MSKKFFIFSDSDLDGICSYITLCWFLTGEPNIPYKLTTVTKFKQDLEFWQKTNKFSDYDKVFFLDMDIGDDIKFIDKKNVVVIDHHKTHVSRIPQYERATTVIKEFSSATKLIFTHFQKLKTLSAPQKMLVALADDYDSYTLKVPQSYDLHIVFYQTQNSADKSKHEKFIESFGQGFTGFTEQQKNLARLHRLAIKKVIDDLDVYGGTCSVQSKLVKVYSTVCERAINEVADHLIKGLNADIAIVVNPNSSRVSWRRRHDCDGVDVSKLAEEFTEGGGHEYAAGGKVTEKFLEFTKCLRPITK